MALYHTFHGVLSTVAVTLMFAFSCAEVVHDGKSLSPLEVTSLFKQNLELNVTWEDPLVQQALWEGEVPVALIDNGSPLSADGRHQLDKRMPAPPTRYKPLIGVPTCLRCARKAQFSEDPNIPNFTAQQLISYMKPGALNGACVFYGQRPAGMQPRSLSGATQDFVCTSPLSYRSIWELWPNDPSLSCEPYQTFYCLNPREPNQCCWLNPLMKIDPNTVNAQIIARKRKALQYFKPMSEAVARTCTGEVFFVADNPDDILRVFPDDTPSIWLSTELPALRQRFSDGYVTKLTGLYFTGNKVTLVGKKDKTAILRSTQRRELDETGGEFAKELAKLMMRKRREDMQMRETEGNNTQELIKRSCGGASAWEPATDNWFG